MKKPLQYTLALSTLVLLPANSHAFIGDGLYIGAGMSYDAPQNWNLDAIKNIKLKDNVGGSGIIGYDWGRIRTEVELLYRRNGFQDARFGGITAPVTGHLENVTVLANLIYEHPITQRLGVYVGAGAGPAVLTVKDFSSSSWAGNFSRDEITLGYQGVAGLTLSLTKSLSVNLGYRYLGATDLRFRNGGIDYGKTGIASHSAELGLRWIMF